LLVAIDAEEGVLAHAREPIDFVYTSCIVEARSRQAFVYIHVAGGTLETWQTKAGRRHEPVNAFGFILTKLRSVHYAIVDARSAQVAFPATRAVTGKAIESIYALGVILARDELTFVQINLAIFAGKSWNTRARKSVCFV
jgi:hypothetical protein